MKKTGFPDIISEKDAFVKDILQQLSSTDEELHKTKKELLKRKSEAADFSYSISHTLRKNIANVKGIVDILNEIPQSQEVKDYLTLLTKEVNEIDNELYSLNEIVKLQYSDLEPKEVVNLKAKFQKIKGLYADILEKEEVIIEEDFSAIEEIFSIKSLWANIFQELLTNAIKFKSASRKLKIIVGSYISEDRMGIEFSDNGSGIDLNRNKANIFKPFYQINPSVKGKGIGLYLLKYQVESLGGEIDITSQLDKGTTVRIFLEKPKTATNVVLNSAVVKVVYLKEYDLMVANWKRKVRPEEFREMFSYILKLMVDYKLKNWIANIINAKNDEDKLNEVRKQFSEQLKKVGLRKMGLVAPREEINETEKQKRLKALQNIYEFDVNYFKTLKDAISWIKTTS